MAIDLKVVLKAAAVGVAGAIVLIIVNGINFFVKDFMLEALKVDWSLRSNVVSIGDFSMYPAGTIVGLAIGAAAIWLCRPQQLKSTVLYPAIAGLVTGVICFFAGTGYELILRPILCHYNLTPLNILLTVLNSCTDILVLAGLAIAGGIICAAFVVKPRA